MRRFALVIAAAATTADGPLGPDVVHPPNGFAADTLAVEPETSGGAPSDLIT
jgi:hypothetical protein